MDVRPRTLGEIFDDAWRLALADAPLLLFLNALFLVPVFIVLLFLLAEQIPAGIAQVVLPALAALLLPLAGLASGACQELFRRRTAEESVAIWKCLTASLRRGLAHAAARGVLLCFTLPGPVLLMFSFLPDTSPILRFAGFVFGSLLTFLLSLPLWSACTSVHVLLSAEAGRSPALLGELRRDVGAAPGKAAVLVLSRLPLLFFLALQLHLLAKVLLWAADNLGGFDTTLLDVQLALFENPVYTLALFQLGWLLLAPFFEAGNFLLHADIRTRQEGLDLQYRVQRAFGGRTSEPRASASGVSLRSLTVAALILLGGVVRAEDTQRERIHAIRGELDAIHTEIVKADPYPGGQRWQARLHSLQTRLERIGGDPQRFRWFKQAIDEFADRKKEDALLVLDDLRRRLSLLEDSLAPSSRPEAQAKEKHSPEDIKSLLRGSEGRKVERAQPRQHVQEDRPVTRREKEQANGRRQPAGGSDQPADAGRSAATSDGGPSFLGWLLLGGLALAVVVVGIFLYLTSPRSLKRKESERAALAAGLSAENDALQVLEQEPAALWRQADALAANERYRDAVRAVYLAVLALLHRQRLIRFEPTRTNGEYVRQVRLSEQAPPELHSSFQELTNGFETMWYGERLCESGDYHACRTLAEQTQQVAARV
ncbi:MAG TPA: DUF4129 domain-containing protein [Gemmataceae bacterium]